MAYHKLHGKFKLKIRHGRYLWNGIEFDTRTMSEATASRLVEMGWPHLVAFTHKKTEE